MRVVALRQEERRLSPRHDEETERAREREREEKKRKNQNLVIQERAELSPPPISSHSNLKVLRIMIEYLHNGGVNGRCARVCF